MVSVLGGHSRSPLLRQRTQQTSWPLVAVALVFAWATCQSDFVGSPKASAALRHRARTSLLAEAGEEQAVTKIEVCIHRDCKRRGGAAKLKAIFEELAKGTDIEIDEYDCFDECPYGPNVRTLAGPDDEFGKVINKVKSREKVAEILGVVDEAPSSGES